MDWTSLSHFVCNSFDEHQLRCHRSTSEVNLAHRSRLISCARQYLGPSSMRLVILRLGWHNRSCLTASGADSHSRKFWMSSSILLSIALVISNDCRRRLGCVQDRLVQDKALVGTVAILERDNSEDQRCLNAYSSIMQVTNGHDMVSSKLYCSTFLSYKKRN